MTPKSPDLNIIECVCDQRREEADIHRTSVRSSPRCLPADFLQKLCGSGPRRVAPPDTDVILFIRCVLLTDENKWHFHSWKHLYVQQVDACLEYWVILHRYLHQCWGLTVRRADVSSAEEHQAQTVKSCQSLHKVHTAMHAHSLRAALFDSGVSLCF